MVNEIAETAKASLKVHVYFCGASSLTFVCYLFYSIQGDNNIRLSEHSELERNLSFLHPYISIHRLFKESTAVESVPVISGTIWGSFAVRGSFAGQDHLQV